MLVLIGLAVSSTCAGTPPREALTLAKSADDTALTIRLRALSSKVNESEARNVACTAYTAGRELAREWRVVRWPPTLQNFLVNIGARKGGLCHQWAAELLVRLHALKLRTLQLHWGESFAGTLREHNVVVVTATGQPFAQGILLDNWRRSGRLVWGPVTGDRRYQWEENRFELTRRLKGMRDSRMATKLTPAAAR
ncbi:MAG: hypothetical protein ABR589_08680 [Chthoniobacterales bacterium]